MMNPSSICELCSKNFCMKCERKGINKNHKHICYGCDGHGDYR